MPIHVICVSLIQIGHRTRNMEFLDQLKAEHYAKNMLSPNPGQQISMDTHFDGKREIIDEIRLSDMSTHEIVATATIKPVSP